MFSGNGEKVHWERMGWETILAGLSKSNDENCAPDNLSYASSFFLFRFSFRFLLLSNCNVALEIQCLLVFIIIES